MEKQSFLGLASSKPIEYKEKPIIGLEEIAYGLARLLVSTRMLCHQSLYSHWQTQEHYFTGLHSLFEHHYQALRKATDFIAARIHMLGYELPDRLSQSAYSTGEYDALPAEEMIGILIQGHQMCAQTAKDILHIADMAGDDESANLLAQRQLAHEKAALLLTALLQNNPPTRSLI